MKMKLLNIVDDNDNIIGQDSRDNIHRQGLLHREVNVWIFNDNNEILFQRRGQNKDTFPGLLDASAGGHVEIGQNYDETAIKELAEETGIVAAPSDLILLEKNKASIKDEITGSVNNRFSTFYAYHLKPGIDKLQLEDGEVTGLEWWPIEKIFNLTKVEKKQFLPSIVNSAKQKIFRKIQQL